MLSGLAYLEKCNIIHTDVKPENILLKSPLPTPPPPMKTMYDFIQEQINNNPEIIEINKDCENPAISGEEKKRLKAKLKRIRTKIRKSLSTGKIPCLWGFLPFNVMEDEQLVETVGVDNSQSSVEKVTEPNYPGNQEQFTEQWKICEDCPTCSVPVNELVSSLQPCVWEYPEDCFYMKMFVLCDPKRLEEGLGPYHGYGDHRGR